MRREETIVTEKELLDRGKNTVELAVRAQDGQDHRCYWSPTGVNQADRKKDLASIGNL